MSPPRTGSVEKRRSKDGKVYYRARVRLGDGSRARIDIPEKYSRAAGGKSGEERAELYALAIQEREDETTPQNQPTDADGVASSVSKTWTASECSRAVITAGAVCQVVLRAAT